MVNEAWEVELRRSWIDRDQKFDDQNRYGKLFGNFRRSQISGELVNFEELNILAELTMFAAEYGAVEASQYFAAKANVKQDLSASIDGFAIKEANTDRTVLNREAMEAMRPKPPQQPQQGGY